MDIERLLLRRGLGEMCRYHLNEGGDGGFVRFERGDETEFTESLGGDGADGGEGDVGGEGEVGSFEEGNEVAGGGGTGEGDGVGIVCG